MKIRTQFFPSPHFETIGKFLFTLITSGLALFFLALVVTAQSTRVGLQGRVADSTGAALPGASVTLHNLNTGMEIVLITAADGSFTLAGARDGRYKITASLAGFGAAELAVSLPSVEPIELRLEPAALADRITVISGSRQEELRESLNTKVDVIGRNRIRDTGYESVAEVLQELPGVMTRRGTVSGNSGSGGEQIQGIDSRQTLVLFDGQPVIGARGIKSGIINLDRQAVGNLESIEVVKGASSALYGSDAIGGVINQITREPRAPMELNLTASGGSQGRADYRGDVGFGGERFSAYFSGERHKQNPFDLTPTTFDTTGAGFGRTDAYAKARYKFTPGFSLGAWARSYWNQSRGRSRGEEGNQESVTDEDSQSFNLQGDWTISPRLTAQGRGYFSRFDEIGNNMLVPPTRAIPPGNLFERYGKVDGSINAILGERQLLQAGAEWTTDRYRGFNRLANDSGHKMETASVFVQDKISFGNRMTVTLGSRFDHNSIFGNAFSPKAGVNVRVHDQFRARFSYGRGFRAPDLGQLYFRFLNPTNLYQVIGNPDLRPERAHSMQLGGEFNSRGRRARLGVNVFYNDVENLIDAVSLGFVASPQQLAALSQQYGIDLSLFQPALNRLLFFYQNISEARTAGVELDGDVKLTRGFLFGGAYTHLNARNLKAGLPLAGRHKHQGNIRLAWESDQALGLRWNLRGTFYSKWIQTLGTTTTNAQTGQVTVTPDVIPPGFALWDFYLAKRIHRGLEFFGSLDNLTNSRDPNVGKLNATGAPLPIYRTELGRTFRVGLRFSWTGERK
ncbi:MAG: TonB-dependent receptor [Acidobacteriota bacterium]|nr:TonB-dependent receptor [Acidobacteriota bacterium]